MEEFASMLGLCIYAAGVGSTFFRKTTVEVGISVGTLLIQYFGLPLTMKSMTKEDYEPLLDKIKSRFLSWKNKRLPFASAPTN